MRNFQEIWEQWEKTHDDTYRDMAYDMMKPKIESDINNVHGVPRSALEAEYAKATYKAFENYNPKKGSFKTYLFHNLKRANRAVYQNYDLYMPEAKAQKMNTFMESYRRLSEKLDREPSAIELADDLGWPLKDITPYMRQVKKSTYNLENSGYLGAQDRDLEAIIGMVHHDASPEEAIVLEYIFGMYGKPALSTNADIARATGMSLSKIKKIRMKLFNQIKEAMD